MSRTAGDPRLDEIVDVLLAYARRDFAPRVRVSDALDVVDAIATGLNMMAEELHGEVASQRELADAYHSLKEAQVKLVHAAKLASIGQLASGVAHEVNNPAAWASLALVLAKKRAVEIRQVIGETGGEELSTRLKPALDELETVLESAVEGVDRIRAVVGDLRTFARADGDQTEIVLLEDVVRATCTVVAPSIPKGVTLTTELKEAPGLRGNRARLGQVVANLLVNAARAVSEQEGGRIVVQTSTESEGALLVVEDSGPGVPRDLWERVFDPFFSTDPLGTGLGLSLVAEIVARHGGQVRVGTSALGGARFEVRLPAATDPLD